ncbi:fructose-1,6-bisphosphatase [Halostella sp. JP-L12]|uniref:class 1 fructose-bisphosphatase n=1 Tax=Halostella TaxID=1843185 RepID=UPI000EF78FDE|nr:MULTISPECIES: class 1 fructose-bisphosphatase [Halostella]NHN49937.1 fructose-1,6-bisphosphatase [Halostella sp. JP-L12]
MSTVQREDVAEAVFDAVAATAPEIRDGLRGRRETVGSENASGEEQLAADLWADKVLAHTITGIDGVGQFVSEERDEVEDCGTGLSVALDPLDGSSNLETNNLMGTIVGVYDADLPAKGRDMVAAAYVLYGPISTMVTAVEGTVTEYEIVDGERQPIERDLTLPEDPIVYGFGGGVDKWTDAFESFAEEIAEELKLRYGGALVGDVNQVVGYGGMFSYPALQSRSEGKLRLQFEGNPIGYIVESAGGRSSDGERSLLDVEPDRLHQRVPVHVGNVELIDRLEAALD